MLNRILNSWPFKGPQQRDAQVANKATMPGRLESILSVVKDADCLLMIGGRGSGKTHFTRCLTRLKILQDEDLMIIDPKPAYPDKWPNVRVVGSGNNYVEIIEIATTYNSELERRKAAFSKGESFKKLTVIVDELFLLNLRIKGFMDLILPLLLEGREYGIHLTLLSQSKRVGALGLKGKGDLLDCFDAVITFKFNKDTEKRTVQANFGQGFRTYLPPPAFENLDEELENLCEGSGPK